MTHRRALLLSSVALLWAGAGLALDRHGAAAPAPAGPYDAIVVAGCRVDPPGVPSPCLAARAARGVALWEAGVAPLVVFTGGVGTHPPAEAEVAAAFAVERGLPHTAARVEARSTSTEANAAEAAALLGAQAHVLVVTDGYHTLRAGRVFARHFAVADATGVTPSPWPRARGAAREVLAVGWYGVRGRL